MEAALAKEKVRGAPPTAMGANHTLGAAGDLSFMEVYGLHREVLNEVRSFNEGSGQSPAKRLQVLAQLDEGSQPLQQAVCRQYFSRPAGSNQVEHTLWNRIVDLYWQLGRGYAGLVKEQIAEGGDRQLIASLPVVTTRAIHYLAQSIKWGYFRHHPIPPNVWRRLHKLYRASEKGGFARVEVELCHSSRRASCTDEYTRILLLDLIGPFSLRPMDVELADQWLGNRVPHVDLEKTGESSRHLYCVNLAKDAGPRRVDDEMAAKKLRFLNLDRILAQVSEVLESPEDASDMERVESLCPELTNWIRKNLASAPKLRLHPREPSQQVIKLFRYMRDQWSGGGTRRVHARENASQRIRVVYGMDAVCRGLPQAGKTATHPDGVRTMTAAQAAESWMLLDRSEGGYGLSVPRRDSHGLEVGSLVAIEGVSQGSTNWQVGTVRRIRTSTADPDQALVGLALLSRTPRLVELVCVGRLTVITDCPAQPPRTKAILLSGTPEDRSLVIPLSEYPSRVFDLPYGGRVYRVRLTTVMERSDDWIRAGFDVIGGSDSGLP